jgi:methylmalonyl-CoA mutase
VYSLLAQEIDFNDIRTTLQTLIAIYGIFDSLHVNTDDDTTPTDESARRALVIQLIVNREWGRQRTRTRSGAVVIIGLTDLVEENGARLFARTDYQCAV